MATVKDIQSSDPVEYFATSMETLEEPTRAQWVRPGSDHFQFEGTGE